MKRMARKAAIVISSALCFACTVFWVRGIAGGFDGLEWPFGHQKAFLARSYDGVISLSLREESNARFSTAFLEMDAEGQPITLAEMFPMDIRFISRESGWLITVPWWWLWLITVMFPATRFFSARHEKPRLLSTDAKGVPFRCGIIVFVLMIVINYLFPVNERGSWAMPPWHNQVVRHGWPFIFRSADPVPERIDRVRWGFGGIILDLLNAAFFAFLTWLFGQLLAFTIASAVNAKGRERQSRGLCSVCGYDLTANVSGACPECGATVEARATAASKL